MRQVRRRISDLQRLLYPLSYVVIRTWIGILCHGVRWSGSGPFRGFVERGAPAILCMWHQDVLNTVLYLAGLGRRYPMMIMVSDGRPAAVGAYLIRKYHVTAVTGSKHRDGGRVGVVQRMADACRESGKSPIITGDGSRGPANVVRWGAVHLARDTGFPIVPMRTWFSHASILPTWAHTQLPWPLPLGQAHVASGEPLFVPADADKATLQTCRQELERRLNALIPVVESAMATPVRTRRGLSEGLPRIPPE